jgi:hypothetical protein
MALASLVETWCFDVTDIGGRWPHLSSVLAGDPDDTRPFLIVEVYNTMV